MKVSLNLSKASLLLMSLCLMHRKRREGSRVYVKKEDEWKWDEAQYYLVGGFSLRKKGSTTELHSSGGPQPSTPKPVEGLSRPVVGYHAVSNLFRQKVYNDSISLCISVSVANQQDTTVLLIRLSSSMMWITDHRQQ